MPHPTQPGSRHHRLAAAIGLMCGLASASLAGKELQWRLTANVPVICAITAVDTFVERPASLGVTTTCNAARFRLVLHQGTRQIMLRSASSSAGPVQISGSAVTISSTRPGHALTTIELTGPASAERLSITLQPI